MGRKKVRRQTSLARAGTERNCRSGPSWHAGLLPFCLGRRPPLPDVGGLPNLFSLSAWEGEIPLPGLDPPGGWNGIDPQGHLGDLLASGLSGLAKALPQSLEQAASQGIAAANTLNQLAGLAKNPAGVLSGALSHAPASIPAILPADSASPVVIPALASPPFLPALT